MDFDPLERIALACFVSATGAFLSGLVSPTFLAAGLAAGMVLLMIGLGAYTAFLARSLTTRHDAPSRSA